MGRKKPQIYFFGEREENGVIEYIKTNSRAKKNKIYNEILEEPFRKINQSILRRYPIHIGNYSLEELEANALVHLIDNMIKYRPYIIQRRIINPAYTNEFDDICDDDIEKEEKWRNMGLDYRFFEFEKADVMVDELSKNDHIYEYRIFSSKAYSYCGTIIRNYYRDHSRDSYREVKTNLFFDDHIDDVEKDMMISEDEFNGEHHLERLIINVVNGIRTVIKTNPDIKEKEIIVGEAIINILENWQILFTEETPDGVYDNKITNKYQKNKVLLMLSEQTGMNTKEMRVNMKIFRDVYAIEKIRLFDD